MVFLECVDADFLAVVPRPEIAERAQVDVVVKKVNRAVDKDKVATAGVVAAERNTTVLPLAADVVHVDAKQSLKKVGKIGRNEPCPCGSGKKFKKCCGR